MNQGRVRKGMIGLLQRVTEAEVTIGGAAVGHIAQGVLVFVGVQRDDDEARASRLLDRILDYRIFPDDGGRMNCNLASIAGGLMLVPQFTLVADTRKGTRPGLSPAADPARGRALFDYLLTVAHARHAPVIGGRFGADMQVRPINAVR